MNAREIRKVARNLIAGIGDGEWTEYTDFYGEVCESVYLGSIFFLTPSGKVYTPWANSNLDACPRCKGRGCAFCGHCGSREAYEDSLFWESLEKYAGKIGAWVETGEGNSCDVYLVRESQNEG